MEANANLVPEAQAAGREIIDLEFHFELKGRGAWEVLKGMLKDIEKEYPNTKVRVEIPL